MYVIILYFRRADKYYSIVCFELQIYWFLCEKLYGNPRFSLSIKRKRDEKKTQQHPFHSKLHNSK